MKDKYDFHSIAKKMIAILREEEVHPYHVTEVFEAMVKELEKNPPPTDAEADAKASYQCLQREINGMKSSLNTIMHTLCNDIDTAAESKRLIKKWGIILAVMLAVNWITIVLCR